MIKIFISLIISVLCALPPAGYYKQCEGKAGAQLTAALDSACTPFIKFKYGSDSIWREFYYTDRRDDNSVYDMYSDNVLYFTTIGARPGNMEIEHCLPKSWWGGAEIGCYSDLFNLNPADFAANRAKSNYPLGVVVNADFDNGVSKRGKNAQNQTCFEPDDEYKGDFARSYLYVATVYNHEYARFTHGAMTTGTPDFFTPEAKALLLAWHRADPVSAKELARQEAVYNIQHNRNPYIDYPNLVEYVFGDSVGCPYPFPSDSRPYIAQPHPFTPIDLGIMSASVATTKQIVVQGGNLTQPLSLQMANGANITLTQSVLRASDVQQGATVSLNVTSTDETILNDTLIIVSPEIDTLFIRIQGAFTSEFLLTGATSITPVSAVLNWVGSNMQGATARIYENTIGHAADLIISGYCEGSSYNKAIAISNFTGRDIDLSHYYLRKQSNGSGAFEQPYRLRGTIAQGATIVVVNSRAGAALLDSATLVVYDSESYVMNFNGNDAVALFHSGVLTDIVGFENNPDFWGSDVTLKRKANVENPSSTYEPEQWTTYNQDTFAPLHAHDIAFATPSAPWQTLSTTGTTALFTDLAPSRCYVVEVACGGELAANALSFKTSALVPPETYAPTRIDSHEFTAEWEESEYATSYNVVLYKSALSEESVIEEHFDSIQADGTPLPHGWTGNASGSYTSAANSGENIPALAFKNTGEWLLSPLSASDINSLEFTYHFVSAGEGSKMIVVALDDAEVQAWADTINFADNKKHIAAYSLNDVSTRKVKFTYIKAKGNLSLDDIFIRSGGDRHELIDSARTQVNNYTFRGLDSGCVYSFAVRTAVERANDTFYSSFSELMSVTTTAQEDTISGVAVDEVCTFFIVSTAEAIEVHNPEQEAARINIFTPSGIRVRTLDASQPVVYINRNRESILIIQIVTATRQYIFKTI